MKHLYSKYLLLFLIALTGLHLNAQTCSVGTAVSSTGYGFTAWGGSAHPTKATGAYLASGSTLTPTNSAILQDETPLIIDMQRLVPASSTFTFAVQRFTGSGNAQATIEYSSNGSTWSSSGTGWGATGISTSSTTSTYVTKTVPTGGFRYVRITLTTASTFLLVDGVGSTHYCPVSVSSTKAIRSFYGPGTNYGSLNSNVYPANAQALQFSTVTSPSHGTWTLNSSTGAYSYSPNFGYDGFEIGVYKVCDGGADGNLATTSDNVCDQDTVILRAVFNCDTNVFYVPIPENLALDHLKDIDIRTSGGNDVPLNVYMGLSVTSDAILTYDHWEDGYETNPRNPTQSTTLIWGDGDLSNGVAPGTTDDILRAGTTSILQNNVLSVATSGSTSLQNIVDYDGRDKVFIHGIGAMSKFDWGTSATLSVSGAAVPRTEYWGTSYTLPAGQTTTGRGTMFDVANIAIMAEKNSTNVTIDYNNDGTTDVTTTLNEGEVYYVDSRTGSTSLLTVKEGGKISATNPVQVMYMTGKQGTSPGSDLYGGRTFPLVPDAQLSTCYVVPAVYGLSRRVFLYNPDPSNTITITRTGPGGTSTFTIGPNSSATQTFAAGTTGGGSYGYQYCSGSSTFTMIACADDNGIISDWGFVPTSSSNLQQIILMSLGFGEDPTSSTFKTSGGTNYEQLLVTPTTSTYFYVDLDGDKVPDKFSMNSNQNATDNVTLDGVTYSESTSDNGVLVGAYRTLAISSTSNDLSGAVIWTKTASGNAGSYGGQFAAIWGQNDGTQCCSPNIDAGYNLPPKIFPPLNTNIRVRFAQVCPGSTTDTIHLNITGGTAPYKIQWINLATGVNDVYTFTVDSAKITGIQPGTYVIKIRDANCLNFQSTVTITQKTSGCPMTISGTVYDDGNGTFDNAINGTVLNKPDGNQLYAYLVNASNVVIDSQYVLPNGTYFLNGLTNTSGYKVRLTTAKTGIGTTLSSNTIPANWVNVGEQYGTNNSAGTGIEGTTTTSDGLLSLNTGTSNITGVDFGLNKRPDSDDKTAPSQPNPGGTVRVAVPALTGSDLENGTLPTSLIKTVIIETLPSNATLYYNGVAISTIGKIINGYNSSLLTVDPTFTGAGTVVFTYAYRDSAQYKDLSPATVTMPFTDPSILISGTVYDDGNGTLNSVIDGTVLAKPTSTQLYTYLVNASNVVLDSQYVLSNGTYSLTAPSSTSGLRVVLTTTQYAIGATVGSNSIPSDWVNVGDAYGTNNSAGSGIEGTTTTANGSVAVTTGTSNITGLDFGLDFRPTSDNKTASSQVNPGGTVKVTVPSLTGGDLEDGTGAGKTLPNNTLPSNTFIVKTLPSNATLYYNNIAVTAGQVIAAYDPTKLTVDPTFNGAGTVTFTYVWRDSAHLEDLSAATVTMPFTDLTLSGQLFDDGDGNYDGAIDGTGIGTVASTQMYAYLDSAGVAVRKVSLPSNGQYSFSNLATTTSYTVVISGTSVAVGTATPSSVALPALWSTTGEQYGTNNSAGSGLESTTAPFTSNGRIAVTTGTSNLTNVNFGINKEPDSDNKTASSQTNPGGTVKVAVPALTGSDNEDGTLPTTNLKTVIISTLPSNATLYYNNVPVTAGQVINGYNSSLLTADPTFNGAGTITFTYAWRDSAHAIDGTPATVTMPFTDLTLSGQLFDDGDGNYDGAIDGTGIGTVASTQMYAYLDSAGVAVRKVSLPSNGQYSFSNLATTTSYTVVISGTSVAVGTATPSSVALPALWSTTGEQYGTNNSAGSGLESTTAPFTSNGRIAVTTGTSNLTNVNFGINKEPDSDNKTASSQTNPGGTVKVAVPALTGSDNEDGTLPTTNLKTVIISTLPSNATLYYNNVPVTAGQVINGYNSSLLTADPTFNGAGTVTFTYAWRDSAHAIDGTPATVTMPFGDLTLSGQLFDDGDGNYDGAIDGTGIGTVASTQMYAYLDSAGVAVRKVTLPSNGQYSFSNLATTTSYTVVISGTSVAVGTATPSSVALPALWSTTGEQYGTNNSAGSGLESTTAPFTSNGRIAVTTGTSNLTNVNFGINKEPESDDKTASSQVNPGGTVKVAVPALTGSDNEDGTLPTTNLKTITISTLPSNATLYYNNVPVTAGQVIKGYNSSLLTVDPNFNGAGSVTFTYAWHDSAQVVDGTPATVIMPFTELTLTGTVYHDDNGLANSLIDGNGKGVFGGLQLYAYLVSAGGTIVDSTKVNPLTGFYDLTHIDANTQYSVRISSVQLGVGVSQPTNVNLNQPWTMTGEQFGSGNNAGSGIETGTPNGLTAVTSGNSNITLVDFGIEYTPWAHDKTYQLSADSVTYGSGVGTWPFYIKLNHTSGSLDTTVTSSNTAVMPGKISGFDLEDGRIKGTAGAIQDKTVFIALPDPTFSALAYVVNGTSYVLVPSPTSSDPAWIYWNQTNGRYEIPAMNPNYLQLFMKLAYQTSMSFQYAYIDTAGLLGRVATYTINSTPLPVSVSDLSCRQQNGIVGLQWTLFDPGDVDHMDIMRASDAMNFNTIGTISLDDQQRNMPSVFFSFTDQHPAEGSAWYRVDVVLKNGLRIRTNLCDQHMTNIISGVSVSLAPNPTEANTAITVVTAEPQDLSITLLDNSGRIIRTSNVSMQANRILIPLNVSDLAAGMYNMQVTWSNGSKVLKIIKE